MKMMLFHVACVVLFVVPLIFIMNCVYKDGIVGRFFLSCICLSAFLFLLDWLDEDGQSFDPPGLAVFMVLSYCGFMVWHLWRFHRRVLKATDTNPYQPHAERRHLPDRRFTEERS